MTKKGKLLQQLLENIINREIDAVIANVTEDIKWTLVGKPPIQGREAFVRLLEEKTKENTYKQLTIANVITHGITAAMDGTLIIVDQSGKEKMVSFCHVCRFNKFKDGKIKEITSYVIDSPID